MKLIIIIITLIIFLAINSFGQIIDEPMTIKSDKIYERYMLHRVKRVTMYIFPIDNKGEKSENGELRSIEEYNRQGLPIRNTSFRNGKEHSSDIQYNKNGKRLNSFENTCIIKNEFNPNGKLLRIIYSDKSNGLLMRIEEFDTLKLRKIAISYNQKGDFSSKSETIYDTINKIYTSRLLSEKNELKYENLYYLNDSLQILKLRVIDNVQNKKYIETITYDNNGNDISSYRSDFNETPIYRFENKFNTLGLKTESIWYMPMDVKKQISIYEYEFYE